MRRLPLLMFALILGVAVVARPVEAQTAGFSGDLPADGGVALVSWGGGSPTALIGAARLEGCEPLSFWATVDGAFVGYAVGVPAFVNSTFTRVVGAEIPAG